MKSFLRALVAFAAVIAAGEGFAQAPRPSLLNRRTPTRPPAKSTEPAAAQQKAPEVDEDGKLSKLNFNQAPLDLVLETYSKMVGKTVLKDPAAPSPTITLKTEPGQDLTKEEQIEAIEIILEMNAVHLEPYGEKFVRALPRGKVRKDGIPLLNVDRDKLNDSGKVVSMMIPFKNISTEEAQKAMEGFKSDTGILLVFERTNSILATDTQLNIKRMVEIAKMIDVATPVTENVFVRQVKYASATEIKTVLQGFVDDAKALLEKDGRKQGHATSAPTAPSPIRSILRPGSSSPAPASANNASLVMSVSDADRGMIRGNVLIVADERSNRLVIKSEKSNMDFFDKVIEALDIETTPDTAVKVYRLKYADAEEVSDMINDLIGNAPSSKSSAKGSQNQNSKNGSGANLTRPGSVKSSNKRTGEAKAGELSKENTTVLADKRINGLIVMTTKELVPVVEQVIESMDVKLSQVLIETVIIEVTLGDDLKTGIDWVQNGRFKTDGEWTTKQDAYGRSYYYYANPDDSSDVQEYVDGTEPSGWSKVGTEAVKILSPGVLEKGGLITGSSGYAQMFGGGANNGSVAADVVSGVATNVFGSALNYVFTSDKLNLSAIIQATKTDSRTKYIASPIVMTVDNKEATIEATTARKFLSNYQSNNNGAYGSTVVPQYESKDIGIKIKVTPKINPNGTVMLEVEEEYSQVGAKQTILDPNSKNVQIDTSLTRKMSADALLENMQTVILCGLTETTTVESESGIPILKDIPWIGKWLFGSVSQSESRSELIIFMTPYVLDDAESAQLEALRRKKSLSDPKPWDDHGWSLSTLADPVSKKEQLRRLKEEWKKQDEERKTKLAIEDEKVKRAKQLEKMSEEERKFWLEQHKEELEAEEQRELEKKMLDKDSQEELRKLAEEIRKKKLEEAKGKIDEADEAARQENERAKFEAERSK